MHVSISRFQQCVRHTAVILLQLLSSKAMRVPLQRKACMRRAVAELEILFMHIHRDEKDNAMWGLQYVKQLHHDGKISGHQVSPEKVFAKIFTFKSLSDCHHLICVFKEHLLLDETP